MFNESGELLVTSYTFSAKSLGSRKGKGFDGSVGEDGVVEPRLVNVLPAKHAITPP